MLKIDELAMIVDNFDQDGDREIDFDEFSKMMKIRMDENLLVKEII